MAIFTSTGTVQTYTVAVSGIYSIDVIGAGGGVGGIAGTGGKGAEQVITTYLKAGQVLSLVVGGMGSAGNEGGGGGGASDVFIGSLAQLLVASGGGGGGNRFGTQVGLNASLTTTGVSGSGGPAGVGGAGGVAGAGGASGFIGGGGGVGGGGGGVLTAGGSGGAPFGGSGGNNSTTFSGGAGGLGLGNGGYGGGGGGGILNGGGGGGGGYSGGGGGGGVGSVGGGGGSFVATGLTITSQSIVSSVASGSIAVNLASDLININVPTTGAMGGLNYQIGSSSTVPVTSAMPWWGNATLAGNFASATRSYFPVVTSPGDSNFLYLYGANVGAEWSNTFGGAVLGNATPNGTSVYAYVVKIPTVVTTTATVDTVPVTTIAYGQSVRLGATLNDGINTNYLGTTDFYSNGVLLGRGTITGNGSFVALNTSALTVGVNAITAVYSGDDASAGSTSTVYTVTVTAPPNDPIPSNITINNLNLTNTILTNKTVFNSVAGDYCAINVISGGGYCGNINNLISVNDLVALSNPALQSSGLLSNGEQILPQCILNTTIINSFIKPIASSIHYCFAAGLANNSNLVLLNDYTVTPYLTDCVVINTLKNCIANVDINSFGGIVISGNGVSVTGLNINNYLIASGGGTYTCGPSNTIMALVGGNAIVQGGSGIDTVIMQGQQYNPIAMNTTINNQITTTQIYTNQGVSTMVNVEYLRFDDQTVAIGVGAGQNAGETYRLYQSALNRTPDQGGLINWIKQLDSGASIISVANAFINSAEFVKAYGNNLSNSALVNALYANVLHRAPDASGAAFWSAALQNSASRAEVLVNFSESAENISNVAALIANGIPVGDYRLVA